METRKFLNKLYSYTLLFLFILFSSCKKIDKIVDTLTNNQGKNQEYVLVGEKYTYYSPASPNILSSEIIYNYSNEYNLESRTRQNIFKSSPFQNFDTIYYVLSGKEYFEKSGKNGILRSIGIINENGYLSKEDLKNQNRDTTFFTPHKITFPGPYQGETFYDTTIIKYSRIFNSFGQMTEDKYYNAQLKIDDGTPIAYVPFEYTITTKFIYNDLGLIQSNITTNYKRPYFTKDSKTAPWLFNRNLEMIIQNYFTKQDLKISSPVDVRENKIYVKSKFDVPSPNINSYKSIKVKLDSIINLEGTYSYDNFKKYTTYYSGTFGYINNLEAEIDGRVISYDYYNDKGEKYYTREFFYKSKK